MGGWYKYCAAQILYRKKRRYYGRMIEAFCCSNTERKRDLQYSIMEWWYKYFAAEVKGVKESSWEDDNKYFAAQIQREK